MKVGYLGPEATFTHLAVSSCFQNSVTQAPYQTIPACMDAAVAGEVDLAFVPLENALEGSVNLTIDYLIHERLCDRGGNDAADSPASARSPFERK